MNKIPCLALLLAGAFSLTLLLSGCKDLEKTAEKSSTASPSGFSEQEQSSPTPTQSDPTDRQSGSKGGESSAEESPSKEDANKEPIYYIGCGAAQKLAVAHLGFEVGEVEKLWSTMQKKQGVVVHEVTFLKDGVDYLLDVDAQSGEILKVEQRDVQ
jgi:hypothetical protein